MCRFTVGSRHVLTNTFYLPTNFYRLSRPSLVSFAVFLAIIWQNLRFYSIFWQELPFLRDPLKKIVAFFETFINLAFILKSFNEICVLSPLFHFYNFILGTKPWWWIFEFRRTAPLKTLGTCTCSVQSHEYWYQWYLNYCSYILF